MRPHQVFQWKDRQPPTQGHTLNYQWAESRGESSPGPRTLSQLGILVWTQTTGATRRCRHALNSCKQVPGDPQAWQPLHKVQTQVGWSKCRSGRDLHVIKVFNTLKGTTATKSQLPGRAQSGGLWQCPNSMATVSTGVDKKSNTRGKVTNKSASLEEIRVAPTQGQAHRDTDPDHGQTACGSQRSDLRTAVGAPHERWATWNTTHEAATRCRQPQHHRCTSR